jgi:hypothetical protein
VPSEKYLQLLQVLFHGSLNLIAPADGTRKHHNVGVAV